MPKRIIKAVFDRVDLCAVGMNQEANVLLYKSLSDLDKARIDAKAVIAAFVDKNKNEEIVAKCAKILDTINVSSSTEEISKALEELEKFGGHEMDEKIKELESKLAKALEDLKARETELATIKTDLSKAQDELKKAEPVDIWKGVAPQVKEQFENMQKALAEATEKQELSEITKRFTGEFKALPGKVDENASLVQRLVKKVEKSDLEKLFEIFKSASALIEKSKAFDEAGNTGKDNTGSATSRFMEEVKKAVAAGEAKTETDGFVLVAGRNPELYREHMSGVRKGVN